MQPGKAQEYFHRYGEVSSVVQYLYIFNMHTQFNCRGNRKKNCNIFLGKQANLENITILNLKTKLNTYLHIFFCHASACFANKYVINID